MLPGQLFAWVSAHQPSQRSRGIPGRGDLEGLFERMGMNG